MLFLVSMTVQIPHGVEPERITRLTALEHERASEHPEINHEQAISLPS
jgi:muconolactone delta-isomerase